MLTLVADHRKTCVIGITDKSEKQQYLDLAETCGLDLAQITKRVVENIRSRSDVDFSNLAGTRTETVDTSISEVIFCLMFFFFLKKNYTRHNYRFNIKEENGNHCGTKLYIYKWKIHLFQVK